MGYCQLVLPVTLLIPLGPPIHVIIRGLSLAQNIPPTWPNPSFCPILRFIRLFHLGRNNGISCTGTGIGYIAKLVTSSAFVATFCTQRHAQTHSTLLGPKAHCQIADGAQHASICRPLQ